MVALDLLDFGPATSVPATASNTSTRASPTISPGDVVFAKYGQGSCFYWAKVLKAYKNSAGEPLCDVMWLRPLAGANAEKTYVLHDGHDETLHGDGLVISSHVRRPNPAEVNASSPPGAGKAVSGFAAAPATKGKDMNDLLGDLIVDAAPAHGQIANSWDAFASTAPTFPQQVQTNSNMFAQPPAQHGSPVGQPFYTPMANVAGSQPWPNGGFQHGFTGIGSQQNGMGPTLKTPVPAVKPPAAPAFAGAPPSLNDLQADAMQGAFIQQKKVVTSSTKSGRDQFDFISDMMSGALTSSK